MGLDQCAMELLLDEGKTVIVELEQGKDYVNQGFTDPTRVNIIIDGWYILSIQGDGTIKRCRHVSSEHTGMLTNYEGKVQIE